MPCDSRKGGPVLSGTVAAWTKMFADDADVLLGLAERERTAATPGGLRHSHLTGVTDRLAAARDHAREAYGLLRALPDDGPPAAPPAAGSAYEEVAH